MGEHRKRFTAIAREQENVHILKAEILNETSVLFQMKNLTKDRISPCFELDADFGRLPFTDKRVEAEMKKFSGHTKNLTRQTLLRYYSQFRLMGLVAAYHEDNQI